MPTPINEVTSIASGATLRMGYSGSSTPPVASFIQSALVGVAPFTVNFTDTSTGSPTSWGWDFTGDGATDSTAQNPTYVFTSPGTYPVRLTATSSFGSHTVTKYALITVTAFVTPVISFSGPTIPNGNINIASGNFSVSVTNLTSSLTITPACSPGTGSFTPSSVTLTPGAPSGTFTFTPSAVASYAVSVTNSGGLTNPASVGYTGVAVATGQALTGPTTGFTNTPATFTVTLNGPVPSGGGTTSVTASGAALSAATLTWVFGGATSQTFTANRSLDGSTSVSITNSMGLTNGSAINYATTTIATAVGNGGWESRSLLPGKTVWRHNFSNPAELGAFAPIGRAGDQAHVGPAIEPFLVTDPEVSGKAIRFIALGARLTVAWNSIDGPGPRPLQIDDDYLWPDPAVAGNYVVHLCDPEGGQDNNLVRITAKSGTTLTATWVSASGQPFTNATQRDWPIGSHIGGQCAINWSRDFTALKADSNGRGFDDENLAGNILRSFNDQTNFPHGPQTLGYGWYGRPEYQIEHATWRPSDHGAQAIDSILRTNLWDGEDFTISWRQKIDPSFLVYNTMTVSNVTYGRKLWMLQSKMTVPQQITSGYGFGGTNFQVPSTPEPTVQMAAYSPGGGLAGRALGTNLDGGGSFQPGSTAEDTAIYAVSGLAPGKAIENPAGEWVTFRLYVKPGLRWNSSDPTAAGSRNTEIKLDMAVSTDAYFRTIYHRTDQAIIYGSSGPQEDNWRTALPGYNAFTLTGYLNTELGSVPPKRSYYADFAELIFCKGKADIPAPEPALRIPAWRSAIAPLTWGNMGTSVAEDVDPENNNRINPNFPGLAPWRNFGGGGDIFRVWNSWCSGAYDDVSGEFKVHGGGHNDYAGNEVYGVNIMRDTPLWRLDIKPTGAIGNTGNLRDGLEDSGVYFDGRPRSTHTYGNLLFVDTEFWLVTLAGPFFSGQGNGGRSTFKFNNARRDWDLVQRGTFPRGSVVADAGSACYDTLRKRVYYWPEDNTYVSYWDIAKRVSVDTGFNTGVGRQNHAIYVAEMDIQICLCTDPSGFMLYDYGRTAGSVAFKPGATGTAPFSPVYQVGWFDGNGVWVPELNSVLCWHGGTNFWRLTPPASGNPMTTPWAWTMFNADGSNVLDPGLPNSTGVYSRFFYSKKLRCLGLNTQPNQPIRAFSLGTPGAPSIQLSGGVWTPNRDSVDEVLISDLAQLPINTVVTVAGVNNKLRDAKEAANYPKSGGGPDGFPAVTDGWSGGDFDAVRKVLYLTGGGHGDSSAAENGIYAVNGMQLRVVRAMDRAPLNTALNWNGTTLVAGEGFPGGVNYPLSNGYPGTTYTYHGPVWIPQATMAAIGFPAPVRGGLYVPGQARAIINLDTGACSKIWWKRSAPDHSYQTSILDGTTIVQPRADFIWNRWSMTGTEFTDWAASTFDPNPAIPSLGIFLASATSGSQFVYNSRTFCRMSERRECVSFAATTTRMRYGAAIDSGDLNWTSYQDTITLTGPDVADFSPANFLDSGTNMLNAGGASYDHEAGCIWVSGNRVGDGLYRITGISSNTWTVTKVAGVTWPTSCGQGTFGKFVVFKRGAITLGMRVSSTTNPIEIVRLA